MDRAEIDEYLADMTDEQLKSALTEAKDDLMKASRQHLNSEWHQSCFAATLLFSDEMNKRGIRLTPLH